ncbi:UNVERIFIED_CONTAM: formylglycine-generating enzyme required for sulfatase activity [Acetivibrio alkalicellulosi]
MREINKYVDNKIIKIPGGEIALRDDRIKRKWAVEIKPFLLSKYLVTSELYSYITKNLTLNLNGEKKPVVNVSWHDAVSFCNLLSEKSGLNKCYSLSSNGEEILCDWESDGYRLPTDAEWEYACKAGTTGARYGDLDKIAWYKENSGGKVHDVGEKEPNPWGLYDMLGNVWEWCWDVYDEQVYGSYRILRGGGWSDPDRGCLATNRRRSHPTFSIDDLGFRLAKSY